MVIKTSEVDEASYRPLKITFDKTRGLVTGTLKNNGHSPEVEPAHSYGASLTGGPLGDNTFELLQFHVHFSCTNDRGSEHKLDGTQLSGHVNVTTMWGFFLLHLTYRYFSFLISWPAGYLCLGKRFQWSITFSIFSAKPYHSHLKSISPKLTGVISQAGLPSHWCTLHMHLLQVPIYVVLWFAIS